MGDDGYGDYDDAGDGEGGRSRRLGQVNMKILQFPDGREEMQFDVPDGYLSLKNLPADGRNRLSLPAIRSLKEWFASASNWTYPYPDDSEKQRLSRKCGMTITQISNWFRNERKRVWLPLKRRVSQMVAKMTEKERDAITVKVSPTDFAAMALHARPDPGEDD